eukprot:TRINITY_DN22333_c0_g1_i1.p1 TRINITY_DN22333_c0_g1~~TRINITY_DN22333_c0_g1_i1.p1  ORF type:complete len:539 (+),score=165.43 TRINITY_DN22333_c0_g1_i1:33-1649(+)
MMTGSSSSSWPLLLLAAAAAAGAEEAGYGEKPHVVVLFADNMGWANVGWNRPPGADPREYATPHLTALAADGMILDRHYTYKFCSPSRSSLLSGRLPMHVNIYNDDPARPGAGIPVGMTLLPEKLRGAGYATHFIGKWHVGMARGSAQPPEARGFDSSLGYFHSANSYYTAERAEGCGGVPAVDLWDTGRPAFHLNGTAYEERLFADRAVDVVNNHPDGRPLFMYYAFHSSCVGWEPGPGAGQEALQADPEYYARFDFVDDDDRRKNNAMVALMDDSAGRVVAALKGRRGMWDATLLLWASDNGGAVHLGGGANVYPLRGGYYNNWEGGVRTAAILAGGFLTSRLEERGARLTGFVHEADWYATFCHLAGVPAGDAAAAAARLPAVDSLNVWPLLTGANATSPRVEWPMTPLGEEAGPRAKHGGDAAYMADGRYKLIVGRIAQAGWCGVTHPNRTAPWDSFADVLTCTTAAKVGCLFDVVADPSETTDLAETLPAKAEEIWQKMLAAERRWFNPDRGEPDPRACARAAATGYWQPYLP